MIKISIGGLLKKIYFEQNGMIHVQNKWFFLSQSGGVFNIMNTIKLIFYEEQVQNQYGGHLRKLKPVMWEKVGYHSRPYTRYIHDGISHRKATIFDTNGIHNFL